MRSKFLALISNDFVKGIILTVLTAAVTIIYTALRSGLTIFQVDWMSVLNVSILALVSYLIKNFFSNSNGEFLKAEK